VSATSYLTVAAALLHRHMPNLPMRFRYPRGHVDADGSRDATGLLLERSDGRRFLVTVRELRPQDPAAAAAAAAAWAADAPDEPAA
jgi:hypothetical protein